MITDVNDNACFILFFQWTSKLSWHLKGLSTLCSTIICWLIY